MTFSKRIDAVIETLRDIHDDAEDCGARAVYHKIQEALGPLESASYAGDQYLDGTLEYADN